MIVEIIITLLYSLLIGLIDVLPTIPVSSGTIDKYVDMLNKGLWFIPTTAFTTAIGVYIFWALVHSKFSVFKWVYQKIPGVT